MALARDLEVKIVAKNHWPNSAPPPNPREAWIAQREALASEFGRLSNAPYGETLSAAHAAMERLVGPCPPPDPPTWEGRTGSGRPVNVEISGRWTDVVIYHEDGARCGVALNARYCEEMGKALLAAAQWQREAAETAQKETGNG